MKFGAAQISLVADMAANQAKIADYMRKAASDGLDVVVFPEAALTGYITDVFAKLDSSTVDTALAELSGLAKELGITALVGTPFRDKDGMLYNSAALLKPDGETSVYHKQYLVSYEAEYFEPGSELLVFEAGGVTCGVIVCRDQSFPLLSKAVRDAGAQVMFICCAHYYRPNEARLKIEKNRALPIARASENKMMVCKANAVGAQDGMVNLGHSIIVGANGVVIREAGENQEELITFDLDPLADWSW